MIAINPNNTAHVIKLIPRFYPTDAIVFNLYNETLQTSENLDNEYMTVNGIMSIGFDLECIEGAKYQIKITEDDTVIFRGKLFATTQNTETFKATKDLYYYE
jgi:hypothetical protein